MQIENEQERLQNLLTAMQAVVSGDFSKQLKTHDKEDDFLKIETGFNLMMQDLEKLQGENDDKIDELKKVLKSMVGRELKMSDLKDEIENLEKLLAACKA